MADSTLRENRRSATHQLATTVNQARMRVLVQQAFYRHDHLGPGAPLREVTGQGEGDGYYDWAGRRLFLADGEPDPMCPGAYRYQHNPAACDLEAPDSDPRSPRYEPMHLRHKPGDTWIIDANRPYDPYDPGPYGSPGWYQDERTGRHRRDETPDPLPAEDWVPPEDAWFPGTTDWPEPEPHTRTDLRDDHGSDSGSEPRIDHRKRGGGGRGGPDHRDESQGRGSSDYRGGTSGRGSADRPPPWGSRGRPVPSEPDGPETPLRPGGERPGRPDPSEPDGPEAPLRPWSERPGRPVPSEPDKPRAREEEPRRPRFWPDSEHPRGRDSSRPAGDRGWISGTCDTPTHDDTEPEDPPAHRFSKLREDAFDRFIANSAQLRAAHFAPQKPYLRERFVWMLRWLVWVLAVGLAPMPAPLIGDRVRTGSTAPYSIQTHAGPIQVGQAEAVPTGDDHPREYRSKAAGPQPVEEHPPRRPGAALAAAVEGARAARKVIADRSGRTSVELAAAVRDSAHRVSAAGASATYWRTQPRQSRPRPSPRPRPGSYMANWEQAFDSSRTLILTGGGVFGAAA